MDNTKLPAEITEREEQILRFLVDQYIRDGQPVGSRTLSRESGIGLSPATLRNVMGDLEHMGLIVSPHTSAGRIPTAAGYRVFVDRMLEVRPMGSDQINEMRMGMDSCNTEKEILKVASSYLSGFTKMAGIVSVYRKDAPILKQIEFLPLSDRRVLVVLVINEKDVQNRIIDVDRNYDKSELEKATNFINNRFAGFPLQDIRDQLKGELSESRDDMTSQMKKMVEMAGQMFEASEEVDNAEQIMVEGQTNLMTCADLSDMETLKVLFDAFDQKRDIYHLLEQCVSADGVQIFIGQESGYSVLDECSLVTAPYNVDGDIVGVLGVVGPTRMAYDRVVPVVDITSRLLSAALNS